MARALNWLDALFYGYRKIFNPAGSEMPERPQFQVVGDSVTIADDAVNNRTTITLDTPAADELATIEYVDAEIAGISAGGTVDTITGDGVAITVDATDPANVSLAFEPSDAVSMLSYGFTECSGLSSASGACTLDATTAANLGTTSATSVAIGHGTITSTITGVTDSIYNGFTNTKTLGRRLRQTTATDGSNTVRWSPSEDVEAHARIIGSDRTMLVRKTLETTTGGNLTYRVERDLGAGAGYADAYYYTTSSPGQFLTGFATTTFLALGSNGRLVFDQDNSSVLLGGSGEFIITARSASQPATLRSATTASSTDAWRIWAFGETKAYDETIVAVGDGTTWTERGKATADGVWDAPELHDGGALKTANFDAKVNHTYICDPSSGAIAVTLEAPTSDNKGKVIEVINFGTSTNNITIQASGGANIIVSSVAAATYTYGVAGSVRRFKSMGGDGWLLICSVN